MFNMVLNMLPMKLFKVHDKNNSDMLGINEIIPKLFILRKKLQENYYMFWTCRKFWNNVLGVLHFN